MNENTLSTDHLIGIKPLKLEDIELILHTAGEFKEVLQRPIKKVPSLRDITIANMFFENSTRTKLSFELAEKRLSIVNYINHRLLIVGRMSMIKINVGLHIPHVEAPLGGVYSCEFNHFIFSSRLY